MNYDFSTLGDRDLEDLCRDILLKKIRIDFQIFKSGSDKGIDLRYATSKNENDIIVQVKHFIGSGLSQLKSKLKNEERNKVILLNPRRYILVTSLKLSPQNKEQLKKILSPYILSTSDILGQDDLNSSLRDFPEIEETHFKLWISSTSVLKRIIKNGVKGRSEFLKSKIIERIKIFVPSKTHKEAVDILNQRKFILITGAPGAGKTTLADILTYQLLAEDFKLTYVTEIREAESAFEPGTKQVFYFDDFLGSITLDLISSRNADSSIVNFLERIKRDKNKRLILTCRTAILNQAKEVSDAINNSTIEISKHKVKISDYGNLEKAKILYNHIFFSNLTPPLKLIFFKNNFHWKIIKHRNYTPRIVQFFTDIDKLDESIDYEDEVLNFLNKPEKIWDKSYNIQLSENGRLLIATLFSLGGAYEISENRLKEAFAARVDYEVKNNNYRRGNNIYNKTLRELLDAFITRTIRENRYYIDIIFKFYNPSIEDFLYYQFSLNDCEDYFNVLESAIYFEQFKGRITTNIESGSKRIYVGGKNYKKLLNTFITKMPNLKSYSSNQKLDSAICLIRLFHWQDVANFVIENINNLDLKAWSWDELEQLIEFLDYIAKNELTNEFLISYEDIILSLTENIPSYFLIEKISKLLSSHEVYNSILDVNKANGTEYFDSFQKNINKCWEEQISSFISDTYSINEITEKVVLEKIIFERINEAKNLNSLIQIDSVSVIDNYIFEVEKQIENNISKSLESDTFIENIKIREDKEIEEVIINSLFDTVIDEW